MIGRGEMRVFIVSGTMLLIRYAGRHKGGRGKEGK